MHRFSLAASLAVLALSLVGTSLASRQDDEQQAYVQSPTRGCTRIAYFGQKSSAGQIAIEYGTPPWKEEYQKAVESKKLAGKRWRLGQDFWTNVDAFFDFKLNGVTIKAGYYYLTLEMKKDGSYLLGFHDPAVIRKLKLDAFLAEQYKGAALYEVPLDYEKASDVAKQLAITLEVSEPENTQGKLKIHFGPNLLKGTFEVASGKS